MAIRIGSNIPSIQAQRRLSEGSAALSRVFERLSSGQRINRASDDAAGLSIASSLSAGRRIYTQGIRNLNDGISALQIADSAIESLSTVVIRIRELAEQAANGSVSPPQRTAIDAEARELQEEYFRISRSASYNRINLFDGSLQGGIRLQGGFGIEGSIQSSLGGVMGDGTFGAKTANTAPICHSVALGDLNGDGILDMVTADYGVSGSGSSVFVLFGKGDGTFAAGVSYATGGGPSCVALGDLNGDGVLDIVTTDYGTYTVSALIGRGDGSFGEKTSYATGAEPQSVALGDLNGDGVLDLVTADNWGNTLSVFIGKGDGTFSATISYAAVSPAAITLGDVNGDGVLDMVAANTSDSTADVFIGNGDGTFRAKTSYATGSTPSSVSLGDLNGDGFLDLVTADSSSNTVSVLIGNGNGSFGAKTSYASGSAPRYASLGDVNGDGVLDIVTADSAGNSASVLIGNGNGTFGPKTSYAVGTAPFSVALGDLNGDGVLDMVTADSVSFTVSVLLGDTREGVAPLLPFSLKTRADAVQALAPLDRKLDQLSAQRGVIGAFQSRLNSAIDALQSTAENYAAAESRIYDADLAQEAADLMRLQISQQAAAAVLAQANQQASLAVRLLKS